MSRPRSIIGVYAAAALATVAVVAVIGGVLLGQRQAAAAEREVALARVEERRTFGATMGKDATRAAIEAVLDDFHRAAAQADLDRYIGHMAPEGVFVGTDAGERWTVAELRAFAEPHFDAGRGWTYVPSARRIDVAPSARQAAFFEELASEKYGTLRGSGALAHDGQRWRILQYVLSFAVPNEVAPEMVANARALAGEERE